MKYIIKLRRQEQLSLNEIEDKIRGARQSFDYVEVQFGSNFSRFIKIAFCKDQTYCIGFNFWNAEFSIKTNMMIKQYPKTVVNRLASYLTTWVNRLNHQ